MATTMDRPFLKVDSREQCKALLEAADAIELLSYGDQGFSYDIHLGRRSEPMDLRIERKSAKDLINTLKKEGHLERQMRGADALLVEDPQKGKFRTKEDHIAWSRAKKTLARMALQFPVIRSTGPSETVRLLEHLRDRPSLEVREKNIVKGADGLLAGALRGLGLNPDRGAIMDGISAKVDLEGIISSLNHEKWPEIPGIGPKAMERIRERLRN